MKIFEGTANFPFRWDQTAKAFWLRYPNPYSKHVLSEDILARWIENGKLYTRRLLIKTNRIPTWAKRFVNTNNVYIIEESVVDPKEQTITSFTKNIGLNHLMDIQETVLYKKAE